MSNTDLGNQSLRNNNFKRSFSVFLPAFIFGLSFIIIKLGVSYVPFFIVLSLLLLGFQLKFSLISKIASFVSKIFSHALAFLLQVFIVTGTRNTPKSGWLPAESWVAPSGSLWGGKFSTKNYYNSSKFAFVVNFTLILIVVVSVDLLAGAVYGRVNPVPKLQDNQRLTASGIQNENLEQIEKDSENFHLDFTGVDFFDPNDERLYSLDEIVSPTVNFSKETGRKTNNPEEYDYTIALIGGSSAFGVGQSDDKTIASEISNILKSYGVKVKIYNFGIPSYTTFQSAKLLKNKVANGLKVDYIIAISGYNDVALAFLHQKKVPASLNDTSAYQYLEYDFIRKWADRSFLARISGYEPRSIGPVIRRSVYNLDEDPNFNKDAFLKYITPIADYNIDRGLQELESVSSSYNIPFLFVWPPTLLESEYRNSNFNKANPIIAGILELSKSSKEKTSHKVGESFFVDLDKISLPPRCFFDTMHTVNSCSKQQAEEIVKSIQLP